MKILKVPSFVAGALLWSATILPSHADAQSAGFASTVVDYTPGTGIGAFTNASSALGKPGGSPGGNDTLNPFNPNYAASELTGVGVGGQLTLALSNFVTVGSAGTREIGFFGNVGLADTNYPGGQAGNPATVFGLRSVLISVSADGVNFVGLNGGALITSTLPANYYANADTTSINTPPPTNPVFADFGKPFTGTLASFNGETYAQTLTTLDGSAGGTWLDLSGTGLAQVGYIRFSEPATGGQNGGIFYLNGVSSNTGLIGLAVPEPGAAVALCLALGVALAWRARRRAAAVLVAAALCAGAGKVSAQMFDFGDIKNWTGSGPNQAALVIDWNDGKGPESLAWGYYFSGTATSLQMFQAIDAADPRLALFIVNDPSFGPFVYGIGYDLNNNGGTFTPGQPGYDSADNSTETGSGSDPADHYAEGEFSKFWGLDISTGSPYGGGGAWSAAGLGAGQQPLVNGDWNGWSLSYDEQKFSIPNPDLPTAAAAVPEPSALELTWAVVVLVLGVGARRRWVSQPARG